MNALQRQIRIVARRRALGAILEGGSIGLAVAGGLSLTPVLAAATWPALIGLGVIASASAALWRWSRLPRRTVDAAMAIERADPDAQNIVRTAVELSERPASVAPSIAARVMTDAIQRAEMTPVARVAPLWRPSLAGLAALGLWVLALGSTPSGAPAVTRVLGLRNGPFDALDILVEPPAYTGERARTEREPTRIAVRVGSRITVTTRSTAATMRAERIAAIDTLSTDANGDITLSFIAASDDILLLAALASDGRELDRRIIGITVQPDLAPRVVIVAPATDLRVPDGDRRIPIRVRAEDDLALSSLRVRFTTVRGNGEVFAFAEGDVPLSITRTTAREWDATGELRLDTLRLEPGDLVVYRAISSDQRPGAAPTESDTRIVEITAPGAVAAEGFAADEDQDRYALSQQMVILKTERLLAQRRTMSTEDFTRAALTLAAEQRSVRAEFVFMMGGELGADDNSDAGHLHVDEAAEAEAEDDIYAGRLANQGRLELTRAIRAMSTAATRLNATELTEALVDERRALTYIERALARSRFILRALSQRERVDLSRRLTGTLSVLRPDLRSAVEPRIPASAAALRALLVGLAPIATATTITDQARREADGLVTQLLRLAPADTGRQRIADDVVQALRPGTDVVARRQRLESAIARLLAAARSELPRGAAAVPSLESRRLLGALRDAGGQ